jgi:hypothetical protein
VQRNIKVKLQDMGVRVIAPYPNLSNAELMVVPAEVLVVFNDKSYEVIMDIGGDEQGAVVLVQYNRYLREEPYNMYFVINNNRPLTSNNDDTEDYIKAIQFASRLKVIHLIPNTNMSFETSVEDTINGDNVVNELSKKVNVPHKYTVCRSDLIDYKQGKVEGKIYETD